MILLELLFALLVALFLGGLFALAARKGGRRTGFSWVFLILFLATWAGGVWAKPFGPSLWGVSWLPFVLAGLIFFLIMAVLAPKQPPRDRYETIEMLDRIEREKKLDHFTYISLSVFFWILLLILLTAIIIRYLAAD
jgi:hypothetical protein